jgi:hypothetical protein
MTLWHPTSHAQVIYASDPFKLTTEGYVNAVGGDDRQHGDSVGGSTRSTQIDGGVRVLGEYIFAPQRSIGIRVEVNASPEEHVNAGERSLLYVDSFGRLELGRRRGLPDSLYGYAPNTYAFTSAEFGVTSGRTLDPGGMLATSFLPTALRTRIDAISGNGVTSAFFGDVSPKVLYVSPKKYGLQLGASYAPKVDDRSAANPYKGLFQTGLAYQTDFGQNFFRVGGSYSRAAIDRDITGGDFSPTRSLHSLSLGSELNFGEVWDFGISASTNGNDSGNADGAGNYGAHGVTASVNYNNGKWVVGGYVQYAKSGDSLAGRDDLSVFQVGVAYRIDPKVRIFAAFYDYRLKNNGSPSADFPLATGNVLLTGIRWTL